MRRARAGGEQGVAVVVTGLLLVPLMIFAAFGVDLAAWYSRTSYLQKAADAASLAGTVWMPNIAKATDVACDSLEHNGITGGPSCSSGPYEITVEPGSTATALRVIVTDPSATRYFSQVLGSGEQRLTRGAEAEYNLPIPLGSPLNFFGGDRTRTQPTPTFTYQVQWPTNYTTRVPANPACNVGTASSQGLGRWSGPPPTFNPSGFSGSTQCTWTVTGTATGGPSVSVPPPDYTTRPPTNPTCRIRSNGTAGGTVIGRWTAGSPPTYSTSTSSTGNPPMCTWAARSTSPGSIPPFAGVTSPTNRPCRVGYETSGPGGGFWTTTAFQTTSTGGGTDTSGNRLCQWTADILITDTTPPNPIAPDRSPGFWAMVEGPGTVSPNGDAYSTRCYIDNVCGSVQNLQYEAAADVNRGYWYVVKMPAVPLASVDINVFDGSYNQAGSIDALAGDRNLGSTTTFPTEFRVYQQNNPLDFTDHTPYTFTPADQALGSCNWSLGGQTAFRGTWQRLCTITAPAPNSYYLINVRTTGSAGNGINGYALEAVSSGGAGTQPALYAYENMGMQNNNRCSPSPCVPPPATFYLAEVGPQYAGKTLVIELWDPGDVQSGDAALFPKKPSPDAGTPRPVVDVPRADCAYTSTPAPNASQSTSAGGGTGAVFSTQQPSDFPDRCGVVTATGGARRLNGVWLTMRVAIPPDYDCVLGVNPEVVGNSCWWGIEYDFSVSSQDVTTWQARIEGNPVHLTT